MNSNPKNGIVHEAVMKKDVPEILQAIRSGHHVDERDDHERSPLFYATIEGDREIVDLLVQNGANVNARDKQLKSALHFASSEYRIDIISFLIENGAEIDAEDVDGNTPLSDAVYYSKGRGQAIKLLLAAGADQNKHNNHGVSPKGLASSISNYNVVQFFQML